MNRLEYDFLEGWNDDCDVPPISYPDWTKRAVARANDHSPEWKHGKPEIIQTVASRFLDRLALTNQDARCANASCCQSSPDDIERDDGKKKRNYKTRKRDGRKKKEYKNRTKSKIKKREKN